MNFFRTKKMERDDFYLNILIGVIAGRGEHNLITNSIIRNSGNSLLMISGKFNGITYCELSNSGTKGIILSGGDRASLTPANNFVISNDIHNLGRWRWSYSGVNISGVGNIVEHNDIHDLRHSAILFAGNNNRIQYNNIYNVLKYTDDSGAIYAGRHWDWRGNKIKYNFIHDVKNNYGDRSLIGIYFDDSLSGNEAVGNIFYNIDGRGIFINGGRDNTVENNIFDSVATVYAGSNIGIKYIDNTPGSWWNLLGKLRADKVNYKSEPWLSSYPRLAAMPNNWAKIKANKWLYPGGNSFRNNIGGNYLSWFHGSFKDNLEYYKDFDKEPIKGDNMKFVPIPFDQIGIQIK